MDYEAIARKWLEQRGVDLAMEGPATVRCIMDGAKMTIEGVLAAAGVPEMEAQCAAMREALADLLALYYGIHPRGSDIRDASDEELEKRMKWLGPNIFRVGPVLAARKALREWEGVK